MPWVLGFVMTIFVSSYLVKVINVLSGKFVKNAFNDGKREDSLMSDVEKLFDELLENPEYKKEYDKQLAITKLAQLIHLWRKHAGLTQKQLAEKTKIRQATISRLESYENDHLPRLETLQAIAHACGYKLTLGVEEFNPLEEATFAPVENERQSVSI